MGMDGETYKKRVIRMSTQRGDFVQGDDGYYVFWPDSHNHGALSPADLRILADHIDKLNEPWDKIIQSDPRIGGKTDG